MIFYDFPKIQWLFSKFMTQKQIVWLLKFYDSWDACSNVSIINFKQITHIAVFPMLTLNK